MDLYDVAVARKLSSGGGGGGGSSDFSTALLTVTGSSEVEFICPVTNGDIADTRIYEAGTYEVILYKGSAYFYVYEGNIASVSGNIEQSGKRYIITGDCTITIS